MKNKSLLMTVAILIIAMSSVAQVTGTFTDKRDGKTYKTVKIGTQTWMAENLAYKPSTGNYWAYNNDQTKIVTYGYLYDWQTAKNVCPSGWHLPSDAEWTTLTTYLGGDSIVGGKLKESGTTHWRSPNTGATNSTGFTALPGGYRNSSYGTFGKIGDGGGWWSSTEGDVHNVNAVYQYLSYSDSTIVNYIDVMLSGFSVRCVRDK